MSYCLGLTLIFSHTLKGITFEEAVESIIQLCTFLLKISKGTKKGGVVDLDLFPNKEEFTTTWILGVWVSLYGEYLLVPLLTPTFISLEF